MSGKLALLVGGAAGYVLGARAGRERYDQIAERARSLWSDPAVRETVAQAKDQAQRKVREKVGEATGSQPDATRAGR